MGLEGGLTLSIRADASGQPEGVSLTSQRPVQASRVLVGKPVDAALKLVSMLFSLCGHAQGIAARRAVEAATGCRPSASDEFRRECLLRAEAAQELTVPMVMEWPLHQPIMGGDAAIVVARAIRAAAARIFTNAHGAEGETAFRQMADCLANGKALFADRLAAVQEMESQFEVVGAPLALPCRPLPVDSAAAAALLFSDPQAGELPSAPLWKGTSAETGPYARHDPQGMGSLTDRTRARQKELNDIERFFSFADERKNGLKENESDLLINAAQVSPGVGIGIAQTARGLLIHRIAIENGMVVDWVIVAPTEWTCHPQGAVVQGLGRWVRSLAAQGVSIRKQKGRAMILQGAEWVMRVMDPCVPCSVSIVQSQERAICPSH